MATIRKATAEGQPTFVAAAAVVGLVTGLVAGSFGLLLDAAGRGRVDLVRWAHGWQVPGFLLVVAICASATGAAAWLVHRVEPHAEGSGIPRVEAVVEGRAEPGRFRILPVKYVGGLLSIGSGLALGREGPSVQMGGNIAVIVATVLRRSRSDLRVLVAAGAAAGLATAFNAPIAGGVFVLEELVKRFDPRTTLATLVASAAGFAGAHLVLHATTTTDFRVPALGDPTLAQAPSVVTLGVVAGLLGVAYNGAVMAALRIADRSRVPVVVRALAVGAAVGAIGWWATPLVGGGDNLTQRALLGHGAVLAVLGLIAVRFVLGVVSYAAATPGGLFAPMLVLGSQLGLLVGLLGHAVAPHATLAPAGLALIGMAAFFTSTVRAPVTGIVLATEMTGSTSQLAPMLGACAIAMLVAMALRCAPIYDQLTRRSASAARENAAEAASGSHGRPASIAG
ncbi:ClC family H(+)/Cl(-) exchange transporter [Allobranchiibius sp. GilTou38]|uniref:ClC family H(+)/Cl(-) exchange transporter n=1 Tax=Allobranchiibius sp. GilTou38 TaxID=2815210 RepID=UPI001AA0D428|nr:ClC family H(+)/Cl(-) exchange transporter [Allobranchiibius sp. GilTou38]MBO1766334.1 ClC family H(+)/Cl(-) exchange transporter [Allobranchiibius sp. GilTou38]